MRLVAGPACDRFGPRYTFSACLLAGAIPTALAGAVTTVRGLLALRFFIGILGGTFVPCQVWSTAFFDKNIVGSSNAFTAGIGNAGGGITYFLMPAVFDSLVHNQHLSAHVAWRVTFIVPFIIITATAIGMLICCPDTPTGRWSDRHLHAQQSLVSHRVTGTVMLIPGQLQGQTSSPKGFHSASPISMDDKTDHDGVGKKHIGSYAHEAPISDEAMLDIARGEVIVKPTFKEAIAVTLSPQTLALAACYVCSFGAELAINSILGAYYLKNFPKLHQTGSGRWAAMFGLLNFVFRPTGGIISDIIYARSNLWGKKLWIHFVGLVTGVFLIAIGVVDSHSKATMFGLVAGMAFFLEAGNGANYSLVPHVHPHANGIFTLIRPFFVIIHPCSLSNEHQTGRRSGKINVLSLLLITIFAGITSGIVGAAGNLGGIIFAIIFRYNGKNYGKVFWITGIITIAINLSVSWIRPIPKGQIGGQ